MDSNRFDTVTRRFAVASRRATLGGLLGLLGSLVIREEGEAQPDPRNRCALPGRICSPERRFPCCPGTTCRGGRCRCDGGRRLCRGECIRQNQCCTNRDCPAEQTCRNGKCDCRGGNVRCGNRCLPKGSCCTNKDCPGEQRCRDGECACPSGQRRCRNRCIPIGDCCTNDDCGESERCERGRCQSGCLEPDQTCETDAECCSGVCNEYTLQCAPDCLPTAEFCRESSDCCTGCCSNDGTTCGDFSTGITRCIVPLS